MGEGGEEGMMYKKYVPLTRTMLPDDKTSQTITQFKSNVGSAGFQVAGMHAVVGVNHGSIGVQALQ
jgi:hypothetical protein